MNQEPVQYQPHVVVSAQVNSNLPDDIWIEPSEKVPEPILILILDFLLPGLGHILMGQQQKGVGILVMFFLLYVVIAVASTFFVGLCCIPCYLIWFVFVLLDGFYMAERLKSGTAIMQGECANSLVTFGLGAFVSGPVFNNKNIDTCPDVWKLRNGQQQRPL